jgi:integrase
MPDGAPSDSTAAWSSMTSNPRAGRRTIALPARLVVLLTEHQAARRRERDLAGDLWEERGVVFTNPIGQPLDPRADNREWAELLKEADVREARLHDARHTADTVLLVLGISQRAVMGLMGWSTNAMTTRYQHLTPDLGRDIAHQVDGLPWTDSWTDETRDETTNAR